MESKNNCKTDPDIIKASRPFLIHQVIATIAFLIGSVLLKLMSDELCVKTTVIYEDIKTTCEQAASCHLKRSLPTPISLLRRYRSLQQESPRNS